MMRKRGAMRITRRDVLKGFALGAAGVTLTGALPGRTAWAQPTAQARSVIQIWMWGGPAHTDTFDPKPDAGEDYTGPLAETIPTNVDGTRVNAAIPLLAQQADKYAIIRSMTHGINGHETASYMVQTGRRPGRLVYPCVGAVVSLMLGENFKGVVPPYIVLTHPQGRFSESGFLGPLYKPFSTGGDPNRTPFAVEGIVAPGISDQRQQSRRKLLHALDTIGDAMPENPRLALHDRCEAEAYDMMFGEARQLFDLSQEGDDLRDRYGRNTFGQSCLMARRLVEHGVPYITINYRGWDTHKKHFETMQRKLPEMDQGMATLLEDLADRSLLESTIVWWSGEFGRSPKVMWDPPWNGGRNHYGKCFSAVLAGGGFKGGRVVGASDEKGENVAERPVWPCDLIRSMYVKLGIDPDGPLANPRGLDLKILPAGEESGGMLTEIM